MNIYEIKIGDEIDVQMGLELAKHFKLNYIGIHYNMKNGCGQAGYYIIRLPKTNISLGVICHEIGHHVAKKKTGQWGHNYKTKTKMRQVYSMRKSIYRI